MDDDTPSTPEFDLASPLLRTQLKAMTPNTPLSNRLVGASFDVGSVSQETRLHDYDDSVSAGEPTPKFELSLLPAAFQVRPRRCSIFIVGVPSALIVCLCAGGGAARDWCRAGVDIVQ